MAGSLARWRHGEGGITLACGLRGGSGWDSESGWIARMEDIIDDEWYISYNVKRSILGYRAHQNPAGKTSAHTPSSTDPHSQFSGPIGPTLHSFIHPIFQYPHIIYNTPPPSSSHFFVKIAIPTFPPATISTPPHPLLCSPCPSLPLQPSSPLPKLPNAR